jgi:cytoskeletal protein CcmA (bactofilin family)
MTGAEVRIDRAIEGDLVAAAGRIHIDQPVGGDAVLGAGSLDVQAPVGEDLRAAGGIVTISQRVNGEVMIAAGRIALSRNAEVHGHTWLAAGSVSIDGRSLSSVRVYGRDVSILGEIYGPLQVSADHIEIRRSARIYGDITYSSRQEIAIEPGAQIDGKVTRMPGKLDVDPNTAAGGIRMLRPLLLIGLFAASLLLYLLFPGFTERSVQMLTQVPLKSLGLGTALFFSIPPVAVLLLITIIGIPIAIALAVFQALAVLLGYLVTSFFIADKLAYAAHRRDAGKVWRLGLLAIALILLALVTSIPYAGPLILLISLAAGMGAIVLQAFNRPGTTASRSRTADVWPGA